MRALPMPRFTIPQSRVEAFYAQHPQQTPLRLGQAFFNYMDLGKMTQDRAFNDALHAADGPEACALIAAITDHGN